METRTYTEKSNARRAAKAAGVDPNLVVACEDGFTFPTPPEEDELQAPTNGHARETNDVDTTASAEKMKAAHAEDERDVQIANDRLREIKDNPDSLVSGDALQARLDQIDTNLTKDDEGIPAFLKVSAEDAAERKAARARNPLKAAPAPIKETATMAKNSKCKTTKTLKGASASYESSANKKGALLAMLNGKGATVDELCKATGWLPHTLRARISGVAKPKSKGGEGLKIERERVDGVTSYRIAS
jgi:hypothetical protein